MELDVYTTTVELLDIPSYTTSITLEGQLLRLSFVWNERIGKRILSIKNSVDECYLQNTILHPNEPLTLNSNAIYDELPYEVTLIKTGDSKRVGNIFDWSKDFILCFSRTVDLDVKKLNVTYGVITPSTPVLGKTFGPWVLNEGFEIIDEKIKYTGYKTNGIDTYDSFALSSLQDALVKSFLDSDLQQDTAFNTAVEQLIGTVDWILDPANKQIKYYLPEQDLSDLPKVYLYPCDPTGSNEILYHASLAALESCALADIQRRFPNYFVSAKASMITETQGDVKLYLKDGTYNTYTIQYVNNPEYDPNAEGGKKLPLAVVAQQVISNAESSPDEILKMLSEDYITLVANSIFDSNPAKQFVKLSDLNSQLESNKVLR